MKQTFLFVVLLLTAAISLHAQTAHDAAKLTTILNEFLAGAGRNDAAVHDRFWADDLIYTRSVGVRTNKPELMKGVRSAPPQKSGDPVTVYTAEDIQIHQYGNTAVVAFRLVITSTKNDGAKTVGNNLNTGTFVKRKGIWQAVAWQSTTVPKPEPATRPTAQTKPVTVKPAAFAAAPNTAITTDEPLSATNGRTYQKGAKGGCYYLNTSGKEIYVNHDLCK